MTQENYIECSVEECTHAKLASGEVVKVSKTFDPPHITVDRWMIHPAPWPRLSITPVKLAPKQEPRKWEFESVATGVKGPYCSCAINAPLDLPFGTKLRVTLEEIL